MAATISVKEGETKSKKARDEAKSIAYYVAKAKDFIHGYTVNCHDISVCDLDGKPCSDRCSHQRLFISDIRAHHCRPGVYTDIYGSQKEIGVGVDAEELKRDRIAAVGVFDETKATKEEKAAYDAEFKETRDMRSEFDPFNNWRTAIAEGKEYGEYAFPSELMIMKSDTKTITFPITLPCTFRTKLDSMRRELTGDAALTAVVPTEHLLELCDIPEFPSGCVPHITIVDARISSVSVKGSYGDIGLQLVTSAANWFPVVEGSTREPTSCTVIQSKDMPVHPFSGERMAIVPASSNGTVCGDQFRLASLDDMITNPWLSRVGHLNILHLIKEAKDHFSSKHNPKLLLIPAPPRFGEGSEYPLAKNSRQAYESQAEQYKEEYTRYVLRMSQWIILSLWGYFDSATTTSLNKHKKWKKQLVEKFEAAPPAEQSKKTVSDHNSDDSHSDHSDNDGEEASESKESHLALGALQVHKQRTNKTSEEEGGELDTSRPINMFVVPVASFIAAWQVIMDHTGIRMFPDLFRHCAFIGLRSKVLCQSALELKSPVTFEIISGKAESGKSKVHKEELKERMLQTKPKHDVPMEQSYTITLKLARWTQPDGSRDDPFDYIRLVRVNDDDDTTTAAAVDIGSKAKTESVNPTSGDNKSGWDPNADDSNMIPSHKRSDKYHKVQGHARSGYRYTGTHAKATDGSSSSGSALPHFMTQGRWSS